MVNVPALPSIICKGVIWKWLTDAYIYIYIFFFFYWTTVQQLYFTQTSTFGELGLEAVTCNWLHLRIIVESSNTSTVWALPIYVWKSSTYELLCWASRIGKAWAAAWTWLELCQGSLLLGQGWTGHTQIKSTELERLVHGGDGRKDTNAFNKWVEPNVDLVCLQKRVCASAVQ